MHKAIFGNIGRMQKTSKTCCGKSVKVSQIAVNCNATCPGCIAQVDEELAAYKEIIAISTLDTTELKASVAKFEPVRYQTVYFL